jgi:hypothetical protein
MRTLFGLVLLAGISAGSVQAQLPSAKEREDRLAYVVAAAKVEGNVISDAAVLTWMLLEEQIATLPEYRTGEVSVTERSLRAEAAVLRAQLSERVEAAMMDNVELLAFDQRCYRSDAPVKYCAHRNGRLAELAGDNAYYHLALMRRAWTDGDSAAFLRHAKAGAAAGHYRSPYMDYYAGLHARFSQVPDQVAPSVAFEGEGVHRADLMAMSVSFPYALSSSLGFFEPCRDSEGELREQCLDIALMQLASAQTPIEVSIAAGVVEALGDEQARELAVERRREAFWRTEKAGELHRKLIEGQTIAGNDAYFEDYGTKGELEAARLLLVANGIAPSPPPEWQSALYRRPASP